MNNLSSQRENAYEFLSRRKHKNIAQKCDILVKESKRNTALRRGVCKSTSHRTVLEGFNKVDLGTCTMILNGNFCSHVEGLWNLVT
jgi:hypothetical protein